MARAVDRTIRTERSPRRTNPPDRVKGLQMPFQLRPRWLGTRGAGAAALTVALLALSACSRTFPNSIFHGRSDFNRDAIGGLFNLILWLGVIVFVIVEGLLVYAMWKYRSRPGQREPEHVHGN